MVSSIMGKTSKTAGTLSSTKDNRPTTAPKFGPRAGRLVITL
jgi:hypothetical protein